VFLAKDLSGIVTACISKNQVGFSAPTLQIYVMLLCYHYCQNIAHIKQNKVFWLLSHNERQ